MTKIGAYDNWKEIFDTVEKQRSYISIGTDHAPGDASDTLAIYFNALIQQPELEDLLSIIISEFIKNKNTKDNFLDVLESSKIVGFNKKNINLIKEAIDIHNSKEFVEKQDEIKNSKKTNSTLSNKKVFIVHGHDELAKTEVARFVEKLGLEAIILHEQVNSGKTIIEKIEEFSNVGFGIVLYTPCDVGSNKDNKEQLKSRARQNVVFEHGYLIGKIGRNNVCALVKDQIEIPNDISGVVYIPLDFHKAWQVTIAKELRNSGYDIDMNHVM
ncbi:nucleotide-binding protein [Myroides odoratimimus]|nr:nucleotide-binding protein [Myroides odoratimimus]